MSELLLNIDQKHKDTLYKQIYNGIRLSILNGGLKAGEKMPSTRQLSIELSVSRATVTLAYEYLLSEGYLESRSGSGTYVSRHLPEEYTQIDRKSINIDGLNLTDTGIVDNVKDYAIHLYENLSYYGLNLKTGNYLDYATSDSDVDIQFGFGRPDLKAFPMKKWMQLMTYHAIRANLHLLDSPHEAGGYHPLKEALSHYLLKSRALPCKPNQIIVVNGSQQGIDLVIRCLLNPNDLVAIEEPGYLGAQRAFQAAGAKLIPIEVDKEGLRIDILKANYDVNSKKILKMVYVTPSHQYPTGAVMPLAKRLELISFAKRTGTIIIEDDYDSEYRYDGRPIPALSGLAKSAPVIYIGTFSKVMLPALRLGYIVVPEPLIDIFTSAKWLTDRHSPLLHQQALTDFLNQGHLERHLRKMRPIYLEKRRTLIKLLKELFGYRVNILGDDAGINILARFQTTISDEEIIQKARELKIGLVTTKSDYISKQVSGEFLFNYAGEPLPKLIAAIKKLPNIIY